ncbi:MAG: ATP-binding protein [Muricomes sp.]
MKNKIAIRPTSGVYATYKRLSYQPWTAIAEFVDNSTQSYFDHRDKLKTCTGFDKLRIIIVYEAKNDSNDLLTITDNAFGMELDDFERAIQLDKAPANTNGRNEFGMGLKTAACWFGSKWSVYSTQLGSEFGYSATVDVDRLAEFKDDEVDLEIFESTPEEHYTIIKIENLNKKITGARTIGKVRELLSNIYRQDIRSGEISITYGENELVYKEPTIFEESLDNGETRMWRKDVSFSIPHNGIDLYCYGFIALRIPASLHDAGFTLLRRGRVIVGGPDKNYRPKELFGDQNSFEYQRLFGELHMDNWAVTQAKDDFDWHTDGLEESFIETLQPIIKEYRQKAGNLRVRQQAETNNVMNQTISDFQRAGVISGASAIPVDAPQAVSPIEKSSEVEEECSEQQELPVIEDTASTNDATVRIVGPEDYNMPFHYKDKDYLFEIHFDSSNALNSWINVAKKSATNYQITINLKHAFFKPFTENKDFLAIMTKLVIAMVLAEIDSLIISSDGRIEAGIFAAK